MKKKTVLIPLDGSPFSAQIVAPALANYDPARFAIVLLHVCAPPEIYTLAEREALDDANIPPAFPTVPETLRTLGRSGPALDAEAQTAQAVQMMAPSQQACEAAGFEVRVEVLFGAPAPCVENYVATHEVDVVAMTTHGRAGLTRLLAGSVAEHVLRHVPVPVLMLRPEPSRPDPYTPEELLKFA